MFSLTLILLACPNQGNPNSYTATNCTVVAAAHAGSQLRCVTAPGIGPGLLWGLTMGTQAAPARVGPTAYGRPVISTFAGVGSVGGLTAGNQVCVACVVREACVACVVVRVCVRVGTHDLRTQSWGVVTLVV